MPVAAWCVDKYRYYVVFSKPIVFILGLIFSFKLVENVLFSVLITYLGVGWGSPNLSKAVVIVNLQEVTGAFAQFILAFVGDTYTGPFRMLVGSTILYIIGLVLTSSSAGGSGYVDTNMLYPALLLMTLSLAAQNVMLRRFLLDQVVARDGGATTPEEEERAQSRSNFWWYLVTVVAAVVVLAGPLPGETLRDLAKALAITKGAAFLLFLLGIKFYTYVGPTPDSPFSDVALVVRRALVKRKVEYPVTPEQFHRNSNGLVQILPHVSWLRWLDKAAVVQEGPPADRICTVEQVMGVKFLFKMIPMWMTFLTFSIVSSSGSTFFNEEAYTLINDDEGTFPILILTNLQLLTQFAVSETANYLLKKVTRRQRAMLVRIGAGMIFCVLCCVAAWANAVRRMRRESADGEYPTMSVYWLLPQYLLLAFMGGLAEEGLQNFFGSQVSQSVSRYAPLFGDCVMGVGKCLSIVFIHIFSGWIQSEISTSKLDRYYQMLAILSSANVVLYCAVARWYGDDTFLVEDDAEMLLRH